MLVALFFSFFFLQVMDRDTLNSIALKFDTTPSEIAQLNRKHHGASSVALIPGEVPTYVRACTCLCVIINACTVRMYSWTLPAGISYIHVYMYMHVVFVVVVLCVCVCVCV